MSSASTSATSTSSGHTELSSSDHQIAAADSIPHPRPRLARLKSGGATFSAGYSMNTNSQRDRVCAPHGVRPLVVVDQELFTPYFADVAVRTWSFRALAERIAAGQLP